MKKAYIILLLLITILISVTGCAEEEEKAIGMIEKIERADWKLAMYSMDYDSYIREMDGLFSESYDPEKHQRRVLQEPIDIRKITQEEREKFQETSDIKEVHVSISKVYEGEFANIFTKEEIHYHEQSPSYLMRKYILKEEDNQWTIVGVEGMAYDKPETREKDWVHTFIVK
ncbi:hypothetical protein NSA47_08725 [Irregularibacter muris]|uniref:Uncharacterized protein n=1 Tax=Irregularibacter muris TaxID=1796619 RepID=A0AAE3HGL9_9FIRM|nr:hypothetical protein [Irregularibacter muris]MCR1899064.1 hypothetical protein [Irregularibacter muris]